MIQQFKANKISIFIGALKEMAGRLSFYVQMGILSMSAVTFWDSEPMRNIRSDLSWLNFWMFIVSILVIGIVIMIIEYVFIMPGSYAFGTRQFNKHENVMIDYLKRIEKKQKEQDDKLEKLNKDKKFWI